MMLYPLGMMQQDGKVFAEHFHRLWGTLVGLITISMMILIWRTDPRRWLRWLMVAILVMVCAQGVMGALWVLLKDSPWRVFHGVFGQVVFAAIASLTAFTSTLWKSGVQPTIKPSAHTDRTLTALLPCLLLVQLVLGALYRHLEPKHLHLLYTHIMMAAVVTGFLIATAGRAWSTNRDLPIVPRLGLCLLHGVGLQIALGVVSMMAVWSREAGDPNIPAWEVIVTTAHQVVGAVLLAVAVLLMLWTRRLLGTQALTEPMQT